MARRFVLLLLLSFAAVRLGAERAPVQIIQKPEGLVMGELVVPVASEPAVAKVQLLVNGIPYAEKSGRLAVFSVPIGGFIRRLRIRAVGRDAAGAVVGEDEIAVNDPQPPFRIRLLGQPTLPSSGFSELTATVIAPLGARITGVDFYIGDTKIGTDREPPYIARFDVTAFPDPIFASATAHTDAGTEAQDVFFWGTTPGERIEVALEQIPLSIASRPSAPLKASELRLIDDGRPKPIERLIPAADLPLHVVLLVDSSESMLKELPLVKRAAKEFARRTVGPNQQIAVVGFAQSTVWLTGFTSDAGEIERAVDRLRARGQTHLYDSVIEMLYELQKQNGRRALVVLTDGVNQGGSFTLDNVVHYARYAGVPVYPIIENALLVRFMRFGLRRFEANRFASIANDSGATWFIVKNAGELQSIYQQIADELRNQYLVLFYSQSNATDEWHPLALSTSRPGVRMRIPRGYFP